MIFNELRNIFDNIFVTIFVIIFISHNFVTLKNYKIQQTNNLMGTNEIVGQNIKLFRDKLGLSQDALANYLGVTREEISYYETGKRIMSTVLLKQVAKLFGVDDYDLFEENPENQQLNVSLAFRAESLTTEDLKQIADFRKIILNYLKMQRIAGDD